MVENSLSEPKSSQCLQVNKYLWIWTTWLCKEEYVVLELKHKPCRGWRQSEFKIRLLQRVAPPPLPPPPKKRSRELFDCGCYIVCPSGWGDILQCEITHNTFTTGGLKMEVLSSSRTAHPSLLLFSFHNVLLKFVVAVSSAAARLNWQSLLPPPSSLHAQHVFVDVSSPGQSPGLSEQPHRVRGWWDEWHDCQMDRLILLKTTISLRLWKNKQKLNAFSRTQ